MIVIVTIAAAGLVAMAGPESLLSSSSALSAFQVPVVNVRPDFYSDLGLGGTSNVLTTAPDLGAQARVTTKLEARDWRKLSLMP